MKAIAQELRAGVALARQDSEFIAAADGLSCAIWLHVTGPDPQEEVPVWAGQPTSPAQRIILSAPPDTWRKLASPAPPPGYQSFTAAQRQARFLQVQGDALAIAQALHALERLFEILRGQLDVPQDAVARDLGAISGHYASVNVAGAVTSVYFESSGLADGPPLVMLHTAGADARQYHGIMIDPELGRRWRMLAFDMPGHGRSPPLPGQAWTASGLTRDGYLAICLAFLQQVARAPALLLG